MRPASTPLPPRHRLELDVPDLGELAGRIEEIEQAAAHSAHGRNFELARPDLLPERRVVQLLGAVERRRRALDLQADGAHGCPVRDVVGMCEAFLFLVDDEIDCALRPARHGLRLVLRNVAKPEAGDELLELLRRSGHRRQTR